MPCTMRLPLVAVMLPPASSESATVAVADADRPATESKPEDEVMDPCDHTECAVTIAVLVTPAAVI